MGREERHAVRHDPAPCDLAYEVIDVRRIAVERRRVQREDATRTRGGMETRALDHAAFEEAPLDRPIRVVHERGTSAIDTDAALRTVAHDGDERRDPPSLGGALAVRLGAPPRE